MATTILVVDDERDIGFILRANLEKEGYRVIGARTAEAGLDLARQYRPDLCILDIMLPKMDGLEMMRVIRQESQMPVLFLTARKDEIDRVVGLQMGADDYIVKPFSVRELMGRVKAILRRTQASPHGNGKKFLRVGGIEMDFDRHEVRVHQKPLKLSPREFQLLKLLVQAQGKGLSREDLSRSLWREDPDRDIDVRTVDQHVARLRKKLLSERHRIATISNFGYQIRTEEPLRAPAAAGCNSEA